ncbi:uncharacterized protein [Triticum aestivum]|uniref:uncharacterized protein n=1 Tax=Triticum aestivum TaxID=4565 RepID=UPI001D028655|nr:uncharacterized protein LOC123106034 [Triticum aestivum]
MITAALPRHIAFAPVLCRPGAISIALQGVGRATARAPADCHLCHRLGSRVRGRAARRAVVVLRLREERRIGCCFGEVEDAVLAKRREACLLIPAMEGLRLIESAATEILLC